MVKAIAVIAVIAVVIVVAVAVVLVLAATKPDTFRVERAATIKAPPEKIFALVNDLRSWGAWSPWEKKDPDMKRSFSGAQYGKGAVYAWDGDRNVGQGRMEITDTAAPSRIVIKLDFLKPFEGHNVAEFTMAPQGDATNVTWAMHGPSPFIGKIIHVFLNMDRMIGNDFEEGLSNLKSLAEK
jgi:uncharacterized protein YndB with AHSA1/START domain